jgi:hypothetical protein
VVNEFPEPDVDDMRKQRDAALIRYIQVHIYIELFLYYVVILRLF